VTGEGLRKDQTKYLVAMVLSLWLGFCGADRFYLASLDRRHLNWAIWKLLTLGGLGLWWLSDLVYFATNRAKFDEVVVGYGWKWRRYTRTLAVVGTAFAAICIGGYCYFRTSPPISVRPPIGPVGPVDNQTPGNITVITDDLKPRCSIYPKVGDAGAEFMIECSNLVPRQMATYKIYRVDGDREIQAGSAGEVFTEGGSFTMRFACSNCDKGRYECRVQDAIRTVAADFEILDGEYPTCGDTDCRPPDINLRSLSGRGVCLWAEFGTPIWVNFWNTSCPGCSEYMGIIQRMSKSWAPGKIKVISVNAGEDENTVRKFLRDRGYDFYANTNYPVLLGTTGIKDQYRPKGDPPHYFLDRHGIIRVTKFGFRAISTEEEVREILRRLEQ
jgi:thiol-disulfide isomerase/thioredoxin/TM2 domain-containing membrane protein YozV